MNDHNPNLVKLIYVVGTQNCNGEELFICDDEKEAMGQVRTLLEDGFTDEEIVFVIGQRKRIKSESEVKISLISFS